jgi:hypothetical protein
MTTEEAMEKADEIRQGLKEDGLLTPDNIPLVEPYEKPFGKWYRELIRDIDSGAVCRCNNSGYDDGTMTCWVHHDCRNGDCTHTDGGE